MHCKHFTISQRLFCPFCQKQIIIRRANLTREKVRVVFNLTLCYSSVFVNTAGNSLQQLKTIIPNLNWISTHLWNWTTIHISERSYPMVEKAAARILTKTKKKTWPASLHWLPIDVRTDFMMPLMTSEVVNGHTPLHLPDLLKPYKYAKNTRLLSELEWSQQAVGPFPIVPYSLLLISDSQTLQRL